MAYIPYNWTAVNSTTDILSMPNNATGGYFWFGMVAMIGLVILVTLSGMFGWEVALLTASFICLLTGLMLVYANLMSINLLSIFIGILIVVLIYVVWNRQE